ncbi:hypothetical protein NX862_13185 [Rhodobacter sp. KR11]|jgi:hypothetical protein|uniref:hypothetical protein n=1 Tax=Rhodobacter sp. KR11 TaxID=2974588 RepID=UPI00222267AC|nr:hypothetical protein [Rhodobacter sp. KR11]MCW1919711.1 hypothetical protein [Rhodobacter sp. KR11]
MASAKEDSLLLDVSDLASGLSQLIKLCKPLVAAKGASIDAAKLRSVGMKSRKLIAGSLDLVELYDDGVNDKTKARALWAQGAMEELIVLDDALAAGLRAARFDPLREPARVVKALKAANTAAGRPSWAKPKVAALAKALPQGGDLEAETLYCGIDARNIASFPLLIVVFSLHKWMKTELTRLPNL